MLRLVRRPRLRVGWATSGSLGSQRVTFKALPAAVAMRTANIARWLDANEDGIANEPYRRDRRYDAVVFVKAMSCAHRAEAERVRERGAVIVFDANVNYYEIRGEYDIAGTKPTEQQRLDALAMTMLADHVVADSSYLLETVRRHNSNATWIPDNVDTALFHGPPRDSAGPLTLVWSGMSHKARHLLVIRDVLAELTGARLVVVSEREPDVLPELRSAIECRYVEFSLRGYARLLCECDVIVSPKRLVNAYELAHTEWKITLGMAVGLPAVASPQQSYVEAIEHLGGGIVADTPAEWREALERVRDPDVRDDLGRRAAGTVDERYATPVVARQYLELLRSLR
jgi:glycosyltransferase involved in cell wall biosynthesis